MPFLIRCLYRPGGAAARLPIRASHIEYMLSALPETVSGGALLDDHGGAIGMFVLLNTEQRKSAERFIGDEPYSAAGLFETIEITDAKIMTPEPSPGFLLAELERQRLDDASGVAAPR